MVFELFGYEYLQRALIAGIIMAIGAPIIGVFMVLRRLSLIGDSLAHTTFAGVALGAFLNIAPFWSALVVTIFSALGVAKVRQVARVSGDAALAVFFSLGLASGIFLISLSPTFPFNLASLLFGSILLITWADVWLITGVGILTTLTVILLFKELAHTALDEELARASGLPVSNLSYLLSILTGVMVVAGMRVVGILLVSALITIPPLSSMQVARSFKQTVILSTVFALISVFIGIILALTLNAAPGGTIVLVSIAVFLVTLATRNVREKFSSKSLAKN